MLWTLDIQTAHRKDEQMKRTEIKNENSVVISCFLCFFASSSLISDLVKRKLFPVLFSYIYLTTVVRYSKFYSLILSFVTSQPEIFLSFFFVAHTLVKRQTSSFLFLLLFYAVLIVIVLIEENNQSAKQST